MNETIVNSSNCHLLVALHAVNTYTITLEIRNRVILGIIPRQCLKPKILLFYYLQLLQACKF